MKGRITTGMVAVLFLVCHPLFASPLDGVFLEAGCSHSSSSDLTLMRMSLQKEINAIFFWEVPWRIRGYWDFSVGYWVNSSYARTGVGMADIGLTPLFRLEREVNSSVMPYLEAGIGVHILSHTSVSDFRRFGSSFQFGDHLGLGTRFGEAGRYDLSYRIQHLSNAGIKEPNRGINYNLLRFGYHF